MNTSDLTQFHKDLSEWGIVLTEKQDEQFLKFYELLVEWNSFMNLTAITEFDEVLKKHFLDSLSFVQYLKNIKDISEDKVMLSKNISEQHFTIIDVGTGAGFPGIPLAILFPKAQFTLMDSLNKRINFLNEVIMALGLTNVKTIHSRAEDLAKNQQHRESYDFAVSRAVANLSTLSEYCLPFVKVGGNFISYKSERLADEMSFAGNSITILGGKIKQQIDFLLPNSDIYRNLLVIHKEKNTPKKYPRKAGLPAKEPMR